MRIEILHQNIYGVGGTVRSVVNLANTLSRRHAVTITSIFRRVEQPLLDIDGRVVIRDLIDLRPDGADRGDVHHNRPSRLVPPAEEYYRQYSELTDQRIVAHLRADQNDVIVGTRPSLNLLVAEYGPSRATLVAQEHMTHSAVPRTVVEAMRAAYGRLDLVTTVTEADRRRVLDSLSLDPGVVAVLPNSVPRPLLPPSNLDSRIVFGVGRLAPEKRYDTLLRAFEIVSRDHAGWRLRLYGDGPERAALEVLARELGIRSDVDFMGQASDMESEWPRAAITVSTSERESFGMTIVESLRHGVPVVSTDCPDGPREVITDGTDGSLVPLGDMSALTSSMATMMADHDARRRMSLAALDTSERFEPQVVADRFLHLVDERGARDRRRWPSLRRRRRTAAPAAHVDLVMADPGRVRVLHAPAGAFWKNAAGIRHPIEGPDGTSTAAVGTDASTLEPGIWNLHAPTEGTRSVRLRPRTLDARVLVSRPRSQPSRFVWAIPYRTFDGYTGLKVWNQERHAEVIAVTADDSGFAVQCALVGAWSRSDRLRLSLSDVSAPRRRFSIEPQDYSPRPSFRIGSDLLRAAHLRRSDHFAIEVESVPDSVRAPVAAVMSDIPDLRRKRGFAEVLIRDEVAIEDFHETPSRAVFARPEFGPDNALTILVSER